MNSQVANRTGHKEYLRVITLVVKMLVTVVVDR